MSIKIIKQYSVFLANEPGALKNFTELFARAGINIMAVSQDVRYDAAVVRVAVETQDSDEISHAITKAGFTTVKTDAVSIDIENKVGVLRDVAAVLANEGINIISIYGSVPDGGSSLIVLVVNDIPRAVAALEKAGKF